MSTVGIRMVQTSIQSVLSGNVTKADSATNVGFGNVLNQSMQSQRYSVQNKQTKQVGQTISQEVSNQKKSVSNK